MEPTRISPAEVRRRLAEDGSLLLVSAYPTDEQFRQAALEGAISFREFRARRPALAKDHAIVFY